jgi:hypothetical protein
VYGTGVGVCVCVRRECVCFVCVCVCVCAGYRPQRMHAHATHLGQLPQVPDESPRGQGHAELLVALQPLYIGADHASHAHEALTPPLAGLLVRMQVRPGHQARYALQHGIEEARFPEVDHAAHACLLVLCASCIGDGDCVLCV